MCCPPPRRSKDGGHAGDGHHLLHMLVGCGLMLGLLLALTWTDAAWSGPLILATLVVCLGAMVVMGLGTGRSQQPQRSKDDESDH